MKKAITIILLFIGLSAFSQAKKDSAISVKHDTVDVFITTVYDTLKVKFWYEDGSNVKVYQKGFVVRGIEKNSFSEKLNKLVSLTYYDEKMRLFTKPVYNPSQR